MNGLFNIFRLKARMPHDIGRLLEGPEYVLNVLFNAFAKTLETKKNFTSAA
jgi:hypothetical protein